MEVLRILIIAKICQYTGGSFFPDNLSGNLFYDIEKLEKQIIIADGQKGSDMSFRYYNDVRFPKRPGVAIGQHVSSLKYFRDVGFSVEDLVAIEIFDVAHRASLYLLPQKQERPGSKVRPFHQSTMDLLSIGE